MGLFGEHLGTAEAAVHIGRIGRLDLSSQTGQDTGDERACRSFGGWDRGAGSSSRFHEKLERCLVNVPSCGRWRSREPTGAALRPLAGS